MEETIFLARVAEQAERFDDMVDFVRHFIKTKKDQKSSSYSADERNLLSTAFRHLVSHKRSVVKNLSVVDFNKLNLTEHAYKHYKLKAELDLQRDCMNIINLLTSEVLNQEEGEDLESFDTQSYVFFKKTVADYYRYIADCSHGEVRIGARLAARDYYEAAEKAAVVLQIQDPVRLGLALNHSVF
jgi:14-3-3 protein epsilon